jgi:hypothetical protein
MIRIGSVHVRLRSVFSEAVFTVLENTKMNPEEKLRQHYDRLEGLVDAPTPANSWTTAAIHCVTRLKCANLAILSAVAVAAMVAYKGLPPTTTVEALLAIVILGVLGNIHER